MRSILVKTIMMLGFVTVCLATVTPIPPNVEMVRGVWIGFDANAYEFYRLVLNENSGAFATSSSGFAPEVHKIDSWNYGSHAELKMSLSTVSSNADPLLVDGRASSAGSIKLHVRRTKSRWERDVVLFKEREIESRLETLRQSMKDVH